MLIVGAWGSYIISGFSFSEWFHLLFKEGREKDELEKVEYSEEQMKKVHIKLEKFVLNEQSPEGLVCKLSNLPIPQNSEVYQCPNCKSFYRKKHLINYFLKNDNCPQCESIKQLFKKKETE